MKIPLTQIRFLYRARDQFGKKVGVVDGEHTWTYEEYFQRCNRLAKGGTGKILKRELRQPYWKGQAKRVHCGNFRPL